MAKLKNLKQIGFSDQMMTYIEKRLDILGVSFPEYIRFLVLQDTSAVRENVPFVTDEEKAGILESMKNLSQGDFVTHRNKGDIRKYFTKMMS